MFLVMKLKTELSKVLQEEKMQRKNKDDFLILTFFVSFFVVRDHWVNMYTLSLF